jgi:hypothetical protein
MSAVAVTKDVFAKRRIGTDQLAQVSPNRLLKNPPNDHRDGMS